MQALARLHPNLTNDLYLKNASQDSFTLFSSFYAPCIGLMGLGNAALTLTLAFKTLFFAASWLLAERLFPGPRAYLAVASLILIPGAYGAFGVFQYAEDWLTARSAAEALVITAIACSVYGYRLLGLLLTCAAIAMHPLMALPGLLWLVCLWLPLRLSAWAAAGGSLLVLAIALIASWAPSNSHLVVMDAAWLEVVRERSQFLLLQYWRAGDWSLNIRVFLSLSLSILMIDDLRVRKFGATAILVGGVGLMVALIASLVGPIAILLQGQAWRWVWVTSFASVLLLIPTLWTLWRSDTGGLLCIPLLVCGWIVPAIAGEICLAVAFIVWSLRDLVKDRALMYHRDMRTLAESLWFQVATTCALRIRANRRFFLSIGVLILSVACSLGMPRAMRDGTSTGAVAEVDAYSDWRRAIPPDANVLVAPARNSAAFAWFTLQRPSYLTVDQSSGVVFSRATAIEVTRRSQVLRPLMDPDWRLLSNGSQVRGGSGKGAASVRPLTRERLMSLCRDPQLNFVVAAEYLEFAPLRHTLGAGQPDWYLYDCRAVDDTSPSA